MPQFVLEFSANVKEKNNLQSLFKDCHVILEKHLSTKLESCKSRAIECLIYCVGNGQPNNAFVHVTLKVMPGRSQETLQALGNTIINLLRQYFAESLQRLNLQITLEIIELQKTYFKITS